MSTWNSTGSLASIQSLHDSSSTLAGDTITIPGGTFNWSTGTLNVTKNITLIGANGPPPTGPTGYGTGTINTIIQNGVMTVVTNPSGQIRLSGFQITGTGVSGNPGLLINVASSSFESPNDGALRVDNIRLDNGTTDTSILINFAGNAPVLMDHCTLAGAGGSELIHNQGTNRAAAAVGDGWFVDVTPGSSQAVYVENCKFINTSTNGFVAQAMSGFYGCRTVMRYNQLNWCAIDQHGTGNVGARWWEFYNNSFVAQTTPAGGNVANSIVVRGGSGLVFNNTSTLVGGATLSGSEFVKESTGTPNNTIPPLWGPGRGIATSAADTAQNPSPAYIWGSDPILGGVAGFFTPNTIFNGGASYGQNGPDWYSSTTQPVTMKKWQTASDNASTTYSYTPFTYPYPLTASGLANPAGGATPPQPQPQPPNTMSGGPPFQPPTFVDTKPKGGWNTYTGPQEDGPSKYAPVYAGQDQTARIAATNPISTTVPPAKTTLPGSAKDMSKIP